MKFTRVKRLSATTLILAILCLVGYTLFSSDTTNSLSALDSSHFSASKIPLFVSNANESTVTNEAESLIFKAEYISRMMGASEKSHFKNVVSDWSRALVQGKQEYRLTQEDKQLGEKIGELLSFYKKNTHAVENNLMNLTSRLRKNLALRHQSVVGNKNLENLQKNYWKKASLAFGKLKSDKCVNKSLQIEDTDCTGPNYQIITRHNLAVQLLGIEKNFFEISEEHPAVYLLQKFEESRLRNKLTASDHLFSAVIEHLLATWARQDSHTASNLISTVLLTARVPINKHNSQGLEKKYTSSFSLMANNIWETHHNK